MKGRQVLIILGSVAALLVVVVVGLAVYLIHTVEQERNRLKTKAATAGRWPKGEQQQEERATTTEVNEKPADTGTGGADQGSGS